jgi:enamine deaminase RidA (YjgF/YER057c/UK114 family)
VVSTVRAQLGGLDRLVEFDRVFVMVQSGPDFHDQHGASNLLLRLLGEQVGRHARAAVGMYALAFDIPVEVEAIA